MTFLEALGALELAPEVLDLPVEEEGSRAVELLLAVGARRLLGHVARLSPVLGGDSSGYLLFLLPTDLVNVTLHVGGMGGRRIAPSAQETHQLRLSDIDIISLSALHAMRLEVRYVKLLIAQ